jgi:hypothetical protein
MGLTFAAATHPKDRKRNLQLPREWRCSDASKVRTAGRQMAAWMTGSLGGFNRSMQHTRVCVSSGDVANEATYGVCPPDAALTFV